MKQPNFIFIDDMGCYGSSFYDTPRIDELASQSMKFTDAYASCPVCSPTKASIMTGKYPATIGITEWIGGFLLKPKFRPQTLISRHQDKLEYSRKINHGSPFYTSFY